MWNSVNNQIKDIFCFPSTWGEIEKAGSQRSPNLLYTSVNNSSALMLEKSADFGLLSTQLPTEDCHSYYSRLEPVTRMHWKTANTKTTVYNERVSGPALKASMEMSSSDTTGKSK